jgi:hypothetical protein
MAMKAKKSRIGSDLGKSTLASGAFSSKSESGNVGVSGSEYLDLLGEFIVATGREREDTSNFDQDFADWVSRNKQVDVRPPRIKKLKTLGAADRRFKFAEIRGRKERQGKQRIKVLT